MSRHLHKSTRTYHGRHVRAPGRVSASLRASDELPAERRLLGFPHVWRQASSKAHEYVRASAHCVRAMLVVRANGAVELAVQKVFVFNTSLSYGRCPRVLPRGGKRSRARGVPSGRSRSGYVILKVGRMAIVPPVGRCGTVGNGKCNGLNTWNFGNGFSLRSHG